MALRSIYAFLNGRRPNPTAGLSVPRACHQPQPPFQPRELVALLDACLSTRDRAMLLFFLGSGVRLSELLAMKTERVDWEQGMVLVDGKGSRRRWVAPGRRALAGLRTYLAGRTGVVWLAEDKPAGLTKMGLWKALQRIAARAGIENVHPHRFRTTFAVMMLEAGADLRAVQRMMGHADIEQTARYADWTAVTRALEQQQRFNPADRLLRTPP